MQSHAEIVDEYMSEVKLSISTLKKIFKNFDDEIRDNFDDADYNSFTFEEKIKLFETSILAWSVTIAAMRVCDYAMIEWILDWSTDMFDDDEVYDYFGQDEHSEEDYEKCKELFRSYGLSFEYQY